jgi:hypothetical protein
MREFINLIDNLFEVTISKYGPGEQFLISDSIHGQKFSAELSRQGIDTGGYIELIDPATVSEFDATLQLGRGQDQYAFKNDKGQTWLVVGSNSAIQNPLVHYTASGAEKPKVANKGEIAEGILGAAMFAKFTKRRGNENIATVTPDDIASILSQLKLTGEDTYQVTVNDANSQISDTISFILKLKTGPYKDLMDPAKRSLVTSEFLSAAAYVNSPMAERYSKYFYLNGKADEINIVADGAASETDKKTDVWVGVKETSGQMRYLRLNTSLKIGGIKQFGQVGGADMTSMIKLWNYFGIDVSKYTQQFNTLNRENQFEALAYIYKLVTEELARNLMGDNDTKEAQFVDILAHAITHFATLGDPSVELVDFNKGGFKILRFKNLRDKLSKVNLTATYLGGKARPEIIIHDVTNPKRILLHIRVKIETLKSGNIYIRSVIEKGKLLEEITMVQQRAWDDQSRDLRSTSIKVPRQKR